MIISGHTHLFKFDSEKALEVLLYVAQRAPIPTIYWVLKILYFADKEHLRSYGRFICGDDYVAMKNGPVPSGSYDIVKDVRSGVAALLMPHASSAFEVQPNHKIVPFRDADLDFFSRSDIECLNKSIEENGHLTFNQLKDKSHDAAFYAADENDFIPIEQIIATFPNSQLLLDYLYKN